MLIFQMISIWSKICRFVCRLFGGRVGEEKAVSVAKVVDQLMN